MKNKFYCSLATFADVMFVGSYAFITCWILHNDPVAYGPLINTLDNVDFSSALAAFLLFGIFNIWANRKHRLVNGCLRCREKKESGMLKKIRKKLVTAFQPGTNMYE